MNPPHYNYKVADAIREIEYAALIEERNTDEASRRGAAMLRWAVVTINRHCQQSKCTYCGKWFPSCGCLSGPSIDDD